ncbi:MAG: CHAD domain-containing protein [Gemmatimonadaceae bacterium]|nr:CHAD domain-containing protein [Gemmatimonadaceae bacterium]
MATTTDAGSLNAEHVRHLLGDSLGLPAQEGARVLALSWLQQLLSARAEWRTLLRDTPPRSVGTGGGERGSADDAEAAARRARETEVLHKARVALRRLRATLRENNRVLDDVADRRTLRALRRLGRATNEARDADVQREWLDANIEVLDTTARAEAMTMRERLGSASAVSPKQIERAFARHLDPLVESLTVRLSTYRQRRSVGSPASSLTFARHLATRLRQSGTRLRRELERSTDIQHQDALHEIRIRLKRQRALLAPYAKTRPALGSWFDLATRAQDQLGAMRDAVVLEELAQRMRLRALAAALRNQALSHFTAFAATWSTHLDDTLAVLERAAQALYAEGAQSMGGIPLEIERKFLLKSVPPHARHVPPTRIDQGWIPGTQLRERLRRSTRPDGTVRCTRTIKFGPASARVELEEQTSDTLFESMWPLTRDARIRKLRHAVPHGDHVWEIDVFLDRELVLAEVELSSLDEVFALPEWLAPFIERDVTDDPAYLNAVMARPDTA